MVIPWSLFLITTFVGSALGGFCRYCVSGWFARRYGERFPIGTMVVNVSGAFLIGVIWSFPWEQSPLPMAFETKTLLTFGFLGGYTTVSSFAWNTMTLFKGREWRSGLFNIMGSVVFCLSAVFAGAAIAPW